MGRIAQFVSVLILAAFFGILASTGALATADMYKKARDVLGKDEVKNCKHCHVKALPKKDDHELSDRGKWLFAEKERREAKVIDVAWLKDYKEESQ